MDIPKDQNNPAAQKKKALLLGVGLDGHEEEKRITTGKNFLLAGGSKPTHELMQEKAIKFNEELDRRSKRLEDIEAEEFHEIADRINLREKP